MQLALRPPGDYLSDVIRDTGDFFEAAILDTLAGLQGWGGVLVDAGAYIGNHTVFFAEFLPHTRIYAFEPLPENLILLRENTRRYPRIVVMPVALSDTERPVLLQPDHGNMGHTQISTAGTVPATAITLDSLALEDVALLKIDVEGHEPQVLAGAADTIARCKPLILIEDWAREYGGLMPDYELVAEWERQHQTFLYAPRA